MFDALESTRNGRFLGESFRRRPVLTGSALPHRPAVRRPDANRPWCVRILGSKIVLRNSFVRASKDTLKRTLFDRLEGKRVVDVLGEPSRRRLALFVPAASRRLVVRRTVTTRLWCRGSGPRKRCAASVPRGTGRLLRLQGLTRSTWATAGARWKLALRRAVFLNYFRKNVYVSRIKQKQKRASTNQVWKKQNTHRSFTILQNVSPESGSER